MQTGVFVGQALLKRRELAVLQLGCPRVIAAALGRVDPVPKAANSLNTKTESTPSRGEISRRSVALSDPSEKIAGGEKAWRLDVQDGASLVIVMSWTREAARFTGPTSTGTLPNSLT